MQSGSKLPHSKLPLPTNALEQIGRTTQGNDFLSTKFEARRPLSPSDFAL